MADNARDDRCAPCTRASLHVRDPSFVQSPLVHSLLVREISSSRTRKVHAEHAIHGRRRRVLRMGWECTCVDAVPSRSCSFFLLFFARFHPRSRKNTILASTHHRHSLHVCVADAWPTSPAFFGPSTTLRAHESCNLVRSCSSCTSEANRGETACKHASDDATSRHGVGKGAPSHTYEGRRDTSKEMCVEMEHERER